MKKRRVGYSNYYIDWTELPDLVLRFLRDYPSKDLGSYKLIPLFEVVNYVIREFDCSHQSARNKITDLVNQRADLKYVNVRTRKKLFGPGTMCFRKHIMLTKRFYR